MHTLLAYWRKLLVFEILSAYIRDNAPAPGRLDPSVLPAPNKPPADIGAALRALGRRRYGYYDFPEMLDLSRTDLRLADLRYANLRGVVLAESHLEGSTLMSANLEGTNLDGAHLEEADFRGANLTGANLLGAHLDRARLEGARLTDEQLASCDSLEGAIMREPDLKYEDWLRYK